MDEESFVRQEMSSSLSALPRTSPSKADEDRYLFLELLASAQDYFLLSYERNSATSSKAPCSLIVELMRYLQKAPLIIHHPLFAFDPCYFKENALIKNYSRSDYSLAACLARQVEDRAFFNSLPEKRETSTILLRDLCKMARHPLQCYFNKRHGIYLERDEEGDEALYLSSLKRYELKNKSLRESLQAVTHFAEGRGVLPEGLFKDVALDLLRQEVEEQCSAFKLLGLEGSDLFSIELSLHCSTPKRLKDGGWVVPALQVAGMQIIGTLDNVTQRGLLVQMKNDVEGVFAAWPLYLVFLLIKEQCEGALLFLKNGKKMILEQDPRPLLEEYIEYYLQALEMPSPLMPKWAKCLVQAEKELFCARVEKTFDEELFHSDPYLEWMKSSGIELEPNSWYERWMPYIEKRFSKVVEWSLTS
jgi:exodeoxyribonuclease V gamma subunit